jgi:hypothetical protein
MIVNAVRDWLWYINIAACALLIGYILRTKLFKTHPFFLAYFVTDEVQQLLSLAFRSNHNRTAEFYMSGSMLKLVLVLFVIWGITRSAFAGKPTIAEFLKRKSGYLALGCLLVALASFDLDPTLTWTKNHLLQHVYTIQRTVYSALIAYLLVLSALIAWSRIRVPRNLAIYIGGFMAFFVCESVAFLILNRTGRTAAWINTVTLTISLACSIGWIAAVRLTNEKTISTGPRWNPAIFDQLSQQLRNINASLGRFVRPHYEQ